MTIFRTFDPAILNRIANIPSVKANITIHLHDCEAPVDFTDCSKRPDDYVLLSNGSTAAAIFERKGPAVLDGHSLFDPSCRGREAIRIGVSMIDWLFENTHAQIVTGGTPVELRAARWFNRQIGFKSDGIHHLNGAHWSHQYEWFHILRSDWTV